jgi:hypothetical protein
MTVRAKLDDDHDTNDNSEGGAKTAKREARSRGTLPRCTAILHFLAGGLDHAIGYSIQKHVLSRVGRDGWAVEGAFGGGRKRSQTSQAREYESHYLRILHN